MGRAFLVECLITGASGNGMHWEATAKGPGGLSYLDRKQSGGRGRLRASVLKVGLNEHGSD